MEETNPLVTQSTSRIIEAGRMSLDIEASDDAGERSEEAGLDSGVEGVTS
jgi:hypothetical protein